ncbi:hypothetical protein NXF25_014567 [Crotalus adamanteus]|uniref:Uncharacterized protein n=1 Tax=Crotalus adamanteus TaxID=8729 RepID=A0AAW1AZL9_CROAD
MEIDKTRWRELGLTPRQLSKKIGVTYSMAEFITQSYRKPVQVQGPCLACPRSSPRGRKCPKKNQCLCNKSGCEGAPGFATLSTPCGRKRQRCKDELSDDECSSTVCTWTERKEVYKKNSSGSLASNRNNSQCKISICSNLGMPKRNKPTSYQKAKVSKGGKKPKCREQKKVKATYAKTLQCCCSTHPCRKKRMIPLGIHLDVPLNIFLDDDDGVEVEGKEVQVCKKWKNKSIGVQVPTLQKGGKCELEEDPCQNPEHPLLDQWGEETESQEETEAEQSNPSEDCSSEEKNNCCEEMPARDKCQSSWWEKVQEGMVLLESLLSSIINKC